MGNYLLAHLSPPPQPPPPYFLPAVVLLLPICIEKNRMALNNLLGSRAVRMHCDASENCDISSHEMDTRIDI